MQPIVSIAEVVSDTSANLKEGSEYFLKLVLYFGPALFFVKILGLLVYHHAPITIYITNLSVVALLILFSYLWFRGIFNEGDDSLPPLSAKNILNYIIIGLLIFSAVVFTPMAINLLTEFLTIQVYNSASLNFVGDIISLILSFAIFYLALRISFIFPAYAKGAVLTLKGSWLATKNFDSTLIISYVRMIYLYALFAFIYTRGIYYLYKEFIEVEGRFLINEILFFLLISPITFFIYPYLVAMLASTVACVYKRADFSTALQHDN